MSSLIPGVHVAIHTRAEILHTAAWLAFANFVCSLLQRGRLEDFANFVCGLLDEALPGGACCGSHPQWSSPEPWLGVAVVSLERAVETRCALADFLGLAHWKVLRISWQWLSLGV